MKNRKLTSLLLFVILISGVVIATSQVTGSETSPPDKSVGVLDVEHEFPSAAQVENLEEELLANINLWKGEALSSSGWWHVVTHHDREKDQTSSLPSGQSIPEDYIMDCWYFLGAEGLVSESVTLMTDQLGNVVQVSIFNNGIWNNLTIGEKWAGTPYEIQLDFGLGADMARPAQTNMSISRYTSELETILVDVVSIEDNFDTPVNMQGYDMMITGGARKVFFDLTTGALLSFERTLTAEDGTTHLVERASYLTIEHVDTLPENISAYLDKE